MFGKLNPKVQNLKIIFISEIISGRVHFWRDFAGGHPAPLRHVQNYTQNLLVTDNIILSREINEV